MVTLVKAIGVVITGLGIIYLIYPQIIKSLIRFFSTGYNIYIPAAVRLVFGIIMLLAAGKTSHPKIITVLGVLFLLGAILIVALGPKRIKPVLAWYLARQVFILRIIAIFIILFGILVIYAA